MKLRAVAALLFVVACGACSGARRAEGNDPASEKARRVDVEPVQRVDVRRTIELVGTLAAAEEVTVASEVDGRVVRILADLGDAVRLNQPLVELDSQKLQYKVDEQRAALERAKAAYGISVGDSEAASWPPIEMTPDVRKAEAELRQADQALKRALELRRRSILSQEQLEDAQARQASAKAAFEAAQQSARNLRAEIEASEASLRLAERELLDATIRTPFDGYVQKRMATVGQFVRVQTPVMAIVRVDPLKLVAEVSERMMSWVKGGQPVQLSVEAYPDEMIEGTISRVSPAVNEQTRAFPVEAQVPNPDGRLKPGTFARGRLESDRVDPVLTVPASAIQNRYGVNRLFVAQGDRLALREVKLGDRLGDRVEVESGVSAGEQVATSGVDLLTDGMLVQPVPAAPHTTD